MYSELHAYFHCRLLTNCPVNIHHCSKKLQKERKGHTHGHKAQSQGCQDQRNGRDKCTSRTISVWEEWQEYSHRYQAQSSGGSHHRHHWERHSKGAARPWEELDGDRTSTEARQYEFWYGQSIVQLRTRPRSYQSWCWSLLHFVLVVLCSTVCSYFYNNTFTLNLSLSMHLWNCQWTMTVLDKYCSIYRSWWRETSGSKQPYCIIKTTLSLDMPAVNIFRNH